MPKDTRLLQEILPLVEKNRFDDVRYIFEHRVLKKRERGSLPLSLNCTGVDVSSRDSREFEAAVLAAARLSDSAILEYLIDSGVDINFASEPPASYNPKGKHVTSPLHVAIDLSRSRSVAALIEANADVNRADQDGCTPLHVAVRKADCGSVRMLLAKGASVQRTDHEGFTPLQYASKYGHVELVRILLEHDAQVFQRGQQGPSPLHVAAMEGHVPLVDLFSRYVDINIMAPYPAAEEDYAVGMNPKQAPALHLAAERGFIETVQFIVDRFGANVNSVDSNQQTALHYVVSRRHDFRRMRRKDDYDMTVDYLLKKGVNFQAADFRGDSALHLAARNQYHRIAQMLLTSGANPDFKNERGETPRDFIAGFDLSMKQLFGQFAGQDGGLGMRIYPECGTPIASTTPILVASPRLFHRRVPRGGSLSRLGSPVMGRGLDSPLGTPGSPATPQTPELRTPRGPYCTVVHTGGDPQGDMATISQPSPPTQTPPPS